ncbi:MAG: PhoH family protein, partial [Clostridia bacterium]|nr:PhoH family protein [Clostridia bacterium]
MPSRQCCFSFFVRHAVFPRKIKAKYVPCVAQNRDWVYNGVYCIDLIKGVFIDMSNPSCPKVDIGGQAVLEGVMMKAPEHIAIAVRRENGDVIVKREKYESPAKKHKWMALPFIRGSVNMVQMLSMGMNTLTQATEMLGVEAYQRLVERGAVEVAPLAYMRGRTLNDAFIILDEAQNTTSEQI